MKKKIKFFPDIDKFQNVRLLYILKLLSIIVTMIVFFLFLIFNVAMKFKLLNPELPTFYTVQIPNILIIISSIIGLYKELIGAILVIFVLFFKILFDQYHFNYFIDILLVNAVINLFLYWGLVRDRN